MKPNNNDTMNLLKELKHKRFNSELNPNLYNAMAFNQPLINQSPSSAYGFVCSYHPTQFVTNVCLSKQMSVAKPLCPRCLHQHMKSHHQSSNPTPCRLQACDTQVQLIATSLTQKLSSCQNLKQTISNLTKWQATQLSQIYQNLHQFKTSLLTQIQKEFHVLEKQIQTKWQRHTKQYNDTVKQLSETMINLQQNCDRSLKLIEEKKQIDSICLSVPQIQKKFADLQKIEEKMLNSAASKIEVKFNVSKINQVVNNVKSSLQVKYNKISGFQVDRILKEQQQKSTKVEESQQNSTLMKLQKLFQAKSTGKLHTISQNQFTKDASIFMVPNQNPLSKQTSTQNTNSQILNKLNDTTNKLKSSLNSFNKSTKTKFHT